jgi:two-component system, OmpR family, sensor histidine kinase BaeS
MQRSWINRGDRLQRFRRRRNLDKVTAHPIPQASAFMPLRLWHRLFLAFAALSILAMATFALLQTRSFQHGFLDYVNRLEREKVETMAHSLESAYAANGSWDFLRGDTPKLMRTLELATPGGPGRPRGGPQQRDVAGTDEASTDEAWRRPSRDRPPPLGGANDRRPPPPEGRWPPPGDGPPGPGNRPRPLRPAHDLPPRLLLLDAADDVVAGNARLTGEMQTIELRNGGESIGRLLLAPLPRLRSDLDLQFAQQQRQQMAVIALIVLLSALALAWALSRWLLHPVRELAAGTRALSAGDFAARIPATRSDELGALAKDFNALAATLEHHRDARRQWGADIAHELRTPISVLSGEIQALQDGIRISGPDTLASLQAECARLQHLVEDLYHLSLSDAGGLSYRFEPVDLAELVREASHTHAGAMQAAGLDLRLAPLPDACPLARADKARLRQLLDNLLSNTMRYTDRPGHVRVGILRDGDRWTLRMDDTAPGVPAAALPHLFERMYRVEPSRSRRFGGAGLGLAICRNIVEAHGGRIDASASPEGGLRIDISLPVAGEQT